MRWIVVRLKKTRGYRSTVISIADKPILLNSSYVSRHSERILCRYCKRSERYDVVKHWRFIALAMSDKNSQCTNTENQ